MLAALSATSAATSNGLVEPASGAPEYEPAVPVAVNVIGEPVRPLAFAVAVLAPAFGPSFSVLPACPCAVVVTVVADSVPPPDATANVTLYPETGFIAASM